MYTIGMTDAEQIQRLTEENRQLRERYRQVCEDNQHLRAQVDSLEQAVAELEVALSEVPTRRPLAPPAVKANRPQREGPPRPRAKRDPQHNRGRQRAAQPTRVVRHGLERCPDCGGRLGTESVAWRREVIELPPPQPVEVTEHVVLKRWCGLCREAKVPTLDLQGQVLGQGRVGVRLASLIGYLRLALRLPYRQIQDYLATLHEVHLSLGELVAVLHRVRQRGEGALAQLKGDLAAQGHLHADETGWREGGHSGYVWAWSTAGASAIRYFEYQASRAQRVVEEMLGERFQGVLISDFYAGYNAYRGPHQRCWVHLLRDLHELKEDHAEEAEVVEWAQAVRTMYDEAQTFLGRASPPSPTEREATYQELWRRCEELGLAYARAKGHPCQALAKRLMRHQDELFQFVRREGLPADNNLAERSLRPLVVMRKISGGTRSEEGSKTQLGLASLFSTWRARGLNPFHTCLHLLQHNSPP
jgi:transposase